MLELITEPLNFEFRRNAIAIGILVGILCPIVGSYLIVQRMALLGRLPIAFCQDCRFQFFWALIF